MAISRERKGNCPMKRTITLLLTLALLLTLCGCGGKTEVSADLDNDRGLSAGSIAQLCEIGDTLYYTMWNGTTYLLYYFEKPSGISGPLCGKPECQHTDKDCNAYVEGSVRIGSYNGMIYYFGYEYGTGAVIRRMAADGTAHETVRVMDMNTLPGSGYTRIIQFHRGYMYYSMEASNIVDGEEHISLYIAAVPLDPNEEITVILDEETGKIDLSVQLYGDSMYIMDHSEKLRLRRWDCTTHDMELLLDVESPIKSPDFWVTDSDIYFNGVIGKAVSEDGTEGTAREVYRYGLSDGAFEHVFSWFTPIGYSDIIADGFVAAVRKEDGQAYAMVVDFQGNTILNESFSVAGFPDQALRGLCQGTDKDYVYLYSLSSGGFGVPLNGGEPILLYTLDQ